jgi:NAD(P)-dependent dehydrogenase (short-subunit alcohol dehydrogenase family)
MGRLDDKTAMVTGGASGLGRAIAGRLAADGARVVITDVRHDLGLRTAADLGVDFLVQSVSERRSEDRGCWSASPGCRA